MIKKENILLFPFFVVIFLIFALTEEFFSGFFTFYISQWVFILPVVMSGVLYFFTDDSESSEKNSFHKDFLLEKKPEISDTTVWKRVLLLFVFQGLFIFGFFWKMEDLPLWLFLVTGVLFFSLFLFFQIALLFSESETQKFLTSTHSVRHHIFSVFLLCGLGILLFSLYQAVFNPFFFTEILTLENIKNFLEISEKVKK